MDPGPIAQLVLVAAALAPSPATGPWVHTLDRLDLDRAAAFATDDVSRLDRVYAPGSGLAEADAAILLGWRQRGLRTGPVRVRVLSVREVALTRDRVELDVVDRLDPVRATSTAGPLALPVDGPTRRTLVLTRAAGSGDERWRIAESRRVAG